MKDGKKILEGVLSVLHTGWDIITEVISLSSPLVILIQKLLKVFQKQLQTHYTHLLKKCKRVFAICHRYTIHSLFVTKTKFVTSFKSHFNVNDCIDTITY